MKSIKRILSISLFLLLSIQTFAYDFIVGGIAYNILSPTEKTVEVTYYNENYTNSNRTDYVGHVVIPETVSYNEKNYTVTSIGNNSFRGCSSLTSVDLSNVTSIGSYAFQSCSSLTSVDLSKVTSIGSFAFNGCFKINSLRIGSVEQWCNVAFDGYYTNPLCDTRQSVELYIGDSETSATEISDENVIVVPDDAFSRCSKISKVSLPNVISIGRDAFNDCSSLTSLDLSNVSSIGSNAFAGCSKISTLRIGSVEQWCNVAFRESFSCPLSYTNQSVELYIGDSEIPATEIFEENVTVVPDNAFSKCSKITRVNFPNVTSIGSGAFSGCSSLTNVGLPNAESIGYAAFNDCSSLTSLDLSNVTSIGGWAFFDCFEISYLSFGSS